MPGESPLIVCEKATLELPEPRLVPPLTGAREPKVSLQVPGLVVE